MSMNESGSAQGLVSAEELKELRRAPLYTVDGEEFGHVGEIWYDEGSGRAEYLKVGRQPLGLRAVLVPVQGGTRYQDGFKVPYTREQLEGAPDFDPDDWDDARERDFRSYYEGFATRDVSDADASMTRSEEELRVGKREVPAGSVRLRKWVETEPVQEDVELRRETARVEREPIDQPVSGATIGEDEVEVSLRAEQPVAEKRTVAKERVGIEKDVETERETVGDELRKERIDVEGDRDPEQRRRTR
jgi:uncharacterized protein (TIGR02271 family)